MATWTEMAESRFNPDDPRQGLLGEAAVLGNPWMEEWLQARGAENLLKRNFPDFVPEQPEILKGATGLFDSLGKRRKKIFDQHDGDSQTEPPAPPSNNVEYNMARFTEEMTNPVNAARVLGGLTGLVPIPGMGLLGAAIGAYQGSHAVDREIERSQGWNPDVSGWEQFWNAVTLGMVGRSGAEQLQEEVEAFSGIDGLFDAEEDKPMTEADRLGIERGGGKWGGPSDALQEAITQAQIEQDLDDVTSIPDDYDFTTVEDTSGYDEVGGGTGDDESDAFGSGEF